MTEHFNNRPKKFPKNLYRKQNLHNILLSQVQARQESALASLYTLKLMHLFTLPEVTPGYPTRLITDIKSLIPPDSRFLGEEPDSMELDIQPILAYLSNLNRGFNLECALQSIYKVVSSLGVDMKLVKDTMYEFSPKNELVFTKLLKSFKFDKKGDVPSRLIQYSSNNTQDSFAVEVWEKFDESMWVLDQDSSSWGMDSREEADSFYDRCIIWYGNQYDSEIPPELDPEIIDRLERSWQQSGDMDDL